MASMIHLVVRKVIVVINVLVVCVVVVVAGSVVVGLVVAAADVAISVMVVVATVVMVVVGGVVVASAAVVGATVEAAVVAAAVLAASAGLAPRPVAASVVVCPRRRPRLLEATVFVDVGPPGNVVASSVAAVDLDVVATLVLRVGLKAVGATATVVDEFSSSTPSESNAASVPTSAARAEGVVTRAAALMATRLLKNR